jgi:hypothetical protein
MLGDGTTLDRGTPVAVEGLVDATSVAAGQLHTCAVRRSGKVVCWGRAREGQIGAETALFLRAPVEVGEPAPAPGRPDASMQAPLPPPVPGARIAETRCVLPRAEHCPWWSGCPSYSARLAQHERDRDGKHLATGTCGALRYIEWSNGFSYSVEYFEANGRLVGAVTGEDYGRVCFTGGREGPWQLGNAPLGCPR